MCQNWIVKAGLGLVQPFSMAMGCEFRQMLAANFDGWLPISQSASFFPFYTDRFSSYGTTDGASRNFFSNFDFSYLVILPM